MNTAERASLTGMVIAFVIVGSGAILESQTTCTQGTCVSWTIASVGGAALVIFGTVLLVISAFFLARERMGRPRTLRRVGPGHQTHVQRRTVSAYRAVRRFLRTVASVLSVVRQLPRT